MFKKIEATGSPDALPDDQYEEESLAVRHLDVILETWSSCLAREHRYTELGQHLVRAIDGRDPAE